MRRFLVLTFGGAAAIALSTAPVSAQAIGFKLGASLSNFSTSEENTSWNSKTGFAGGGFIRFGFGRFGIQPEVLSVSKGAELEILGQESETSLEYIEIPVLLHVPLSMSPTFAPYVFAGPAFGFEIGCDRTNALDTVDCGDDENRKKTDIGVTAGGGLAFAMGPGALLIDGRYTWGTTEIFGEASGVKNRAALFMAGYSIRLTR